ncbi:hypothetical protein DYY67_2339 [Candidatus Nitrosotalea sp. TS]|nr:hypothetical protein [Candidatus Nitrosotalea sp. TS]
MVMSYVFCPLWLHERRMPPAIAGEASRLDEGAQPPHLSEVVPSVGSPAIGNLSGLTRGHVRRSGRGSPLLRPNDDGWLINQYFIVNQYVVTLLRGSGRAFSYTGSLRERLAGATCRQLTAGRHRRRAYGPA